MKKRICVVLLLIAAVSVGAVFAQDLMMWGEGSSKSTTSNLRVGDGQHITVIRCYLNTAKNRIEVTYKSNTGLLLGGRFNFSVSYKKKDRKQGDPIDLGLLDWYTNNETLIKADKEYTINVPIGKSFRDMIPTSVGIEFEQKVKDKPYKPPKTPKEKKDWVDRMFPPLNLQPAR